MEIVSAGSLESISRPSSTTSEKERKSQLKRLQPSSSLEVLPPEDVGGVPSELLSAIEKDISIEDFKEYAESSHDVDLSEGDTTDPDEPKEGHQSRASEAVQEDMPALEDSDVDPQIREGMDKIKKLDKILADKQKKEKEVKYQRVQMEKMWKEQLQKMAKTQEDSCANTNKNLIGAALLALELGNEESLDSSRGDPSTPIFATQPLGTEESCYQTSSTTTGRTSRISSCASNSNNGSRKGGNKKEKRRQSAQTGQEKNANKKQTSSKDSGQDFIERNKKLAADAANWIPMTDEEKLRLEKLLSSEVNEMMDNPFNDDSNLRLTQGNGFTPDEDSARALAEIDRKLEALVPTNELEMLSSRALTDTPLSQMTDVSKTDSHINPRQTKENIEDVGIGEKVLREEKESRTLNQRILDIEKQLESLQNLSEDDTINTISQALLTKLLNEDTRTTSGNSTIAETVVSSLTTPDFLALESPNAHRTETALSDVTLASDVTLTCDVNIVDVETLRTLTDSFDT